MSSTRVLLGCGVVAIESTMATMATTATIKQKRCLLEHNRGSDHKGEGRGEESYEKE